MNYAEKIIIDGGKDLAAPTTGLATAGELAGYIAAAAVWLRGPESSFITARLQPVDSAMLADNPP